MTFLRDRAHGVVRCLVLLFVFALLCQPLAALTKLYDALDACKDPAAFKALVLQMNKHSAAVLSPTATPKDYIFDESHEPGHRGQTWPFDYLIENGRFEHALMLLKAYKDVDPKTDYKFDGTFTNPVGLAYRAGRLDIVKQMVALDKRLLDMCNETGSYFGAVPVAYAVSTNDLDTVKYFFSQGADPKTMYVFDRRADIEYESNLFNLSKTKEMDELLTASGTPEAYLYDQPWQTFCVDNRVRVRSAASTESEVLALIDKGQKLSVLGYRFRFETIGEKTDTWFLIDWKGRKAWVFGTFVDKGSW